MSEKIWSYGGVEFKVGDVVRVVRKTKSHCKDGMGLGVEWQNSWEGFMNKAIGEYCTIDSISSSGAWLGDFTHSCRFPLASLEKVPTLSKQELPDGDFTLVDVSGVVYTVYSSPCNTEYYNVSWSFPVCEEELVTYCSGVEILKAIKSGFWKICKSAEQEAREFKIACLKAEVEVLTNEIAQLEKEANV